MSAHSDAKAIRDAIKGLGTDDAKLVEVITHRTNEQLVSITAEYTAAFGKSIFEDIKGDTSGNYRELLISLVEPRPTYIAKVVHNAIKGAGTNEGALIDALVHTPNYLIKAASEAYQKLYNKSIVEDVVGDTSGDFKRVLVGLLGGQRKETGADLSRAEHDADHIYKKGEGKIGTDEDAFVEFFLQSSPAHIFEVDRIYTQKHGHGLVVAINKEFSGNIRRILKGLAQPPQVYWARRIHHAISGLGTDDSALIRAFVLNNREQLRSVEAAYKDHVERKKSGGHKDKKKEHKKVATGSIEHDIKGDTSGWYEKALLSLIR